MALHPRAVHDPAARLRHRSRSGGVLLREDRVVSPFFRALKRALKGTGSRDPRLKPGATVLTQASPAVIANSEFAITNYANIDCNSGGVAVVRTVAHGFSRGSDRTVRA